MALVRPAVYDNLAQRMPLPGDLLSGAEVILTNATVGSTVVTAAQLISGILNRSGSAGAFADTLPTATLLINALLSNTFLGSGSYGPLGVLNGTTFRLRYINSVAFVDTITAPDTSVTLGANTAIAASSVKEFLITITNGTQAQLFAANQTNASAVITGLSALQTSMLTAGMLVTGTNIPASTLVLSVQPGVGVTLSANATATLSGNPLTFSPTYRIDSLGQMLL